MSNIGAFMMCSGKIKQVDVAIREYQSRGRS